MIKDINRPPIPQVMPDNLGAVVKHQASELEFLEARCQALEQAVNLIIASCENPCIRRAHSDLQMQKFLDKTREILLGDVGLPKKGIPTNLEVYEKVCDTRNNKNLYVSTNAVNDVMAAVRVLMSGRVK